MKSLETSSFKINTSLIIKILYFCFAFLMIMRDLNGIPVNKYCFIIIAIIIFICGHCEEIFAFMAFLTPMHMGVPYTYIIIIAAIAMIIKKKKFKISTFGFVGIMIILLLELFNGFRMEFFITEFIKFVGIFLFCFIIVLDQERQIDGIRGAINYIWGFFFAAIDLWGQMLQSYSISEILMLRVRFGNMRQIFDVESEGMLLSYNPNMLGALCVIAALLSLFLIKMKYNKNTILLYLVFLLSVTMCIMTISRTAILCLILGIFLVILFSDNYILYHLRSVLIGACLLILILIILKHFMPEYFVFMDQRFNASDKLNGRLDIFTQYFDVMFAHIDRILFGVGIQNYQDKYRMINSAHNAIQETMIAWGVIGLIDIVVMFFISIYNLIKKNGNFRVIQGIPFIIFFIILQAGQGFSVRGNILILLVTFSALTIDMKKNKNCGSDIEINGRK